MLSHPILEIFLRDLNKLKEEIALYKNENDLWIVKGEIKNSAGNLCLHLCGNLNFFIGTTLGKTGYVRNRDLEFSAKNISAEELISQIEETIEFVKNVLSKISDEEMLKFFSIDFLGKRPLTIEMLFQLIGHLNYHLGQINYHRRLVTFASP